MNDGSEVLGSMIDILSNLKKRKAYHQKEVDDIAVDIEKVENDIIHLMVEMKLDKAAYNGVTIAPKEHTYAHVEDWAQLYKFIEDEHYLHLLEKRVSVTGYRELLELGRQVPGVVPFVKTKLSVTKSLR